MMCVRFTEKYLEFARECIPTKTITIRDRDKPWFNSGIKREMKIRDSLHKKMRKQPNINNICKYKVQRNKVNNMIIHAKQQFFLNSNDFLDENSSDPNGLSRSRIVIVFVGIHSRASSKYFSVNRTHIMFIFWVQLDNNLYQSVKKLMGNVGRSCTMPPLLDTENDILYVDDIDKCNLINSFFCSICIAILVVPVSVGNTVFNHIFNKTSKFRAHYLPHPLKREVTKWLLIPDEGCYI
jgi:hypothetical protein